MSHRSTIVVAIVSKALGIAIGTSIATVSDSLAQVSRTPDRRGPLVDKLEEPVQAEPDQDAPIESLWCLPDWYVADRGEGHYKYHYDCRMRDQIRCHPDYDFQTESVHFEFTRLQYRCQKFKS